MDAEGTGGEEDDPTPPPLTNDEQEASLKSGVDEPPENIDDELTSLNAPITDEADVDGEFRLSIEMPPPVVIAEIKRQSRHLSKFLSEDEVSSMKKKIDTAMLGEVENSALETEVDPPLEEAVNIPVTEDEVQTDNPTVEKQQSDPIVEENKSNPSVGRNKSNPSVGGNQSNPSVGGNQSNPSVGGNKSNPSVGGNQSNPSVGENKSNPSVGENKSNPSVGENKFDPTVEENKFDPIVEENKFDPIVEENKFDPIVEENKSDPTIEENIQNPTVEEKKSDPTVEEDIVEIVRRDDEFTDDTQTTYDTDNPETPNRLSQSQEPNDFANAHRKIQEVDNLICNRNSSSCQPQKITLGEPEKEQLQAAGLHILQIGQELLNEMNFIETVLSKFGSFVLSEKDGSAKRKSSSVRDGNDGQEHELTSVEDDKLAKSKIIEAIAAQAKQLCWLDQKQTEDFKNDTKGAKFGSAFESPHFSETLVSAQYRSPRSSCEPAVTAADTTSAQYNQNNNDFRKRLATLEIKVEGMNSKLEFCEKQVKEVYHTLCGALNKLSEETVILRQQIGNEGERGAMLRTTIEEKICGFEQQIMKLAKVIWELRCETHAQMHFGRLDC